jgi:hypothetical protein
VGVFEVELLLFAEVSDCLAHIILFFIDRRKSLIEVLHDEIGTGGDFLQKIGFLTWFKLVIFDEGLNVFESLDETIAVFEVQIELV